MKTLSLCVVLLALASTVRAQAWDPLQRFESRFQSSVQQLTQDRPPKPRNRALSIQRTAADLEKEATAIALRQGRSDDATFEADPTAVAEIAAMLADLRARYPEIAALPAGVGQGTSVIVQLKPAAEQQVAAAYPIAPNSFSAHAATKTLGLKDLDDAVAVLGGRYELTVYKGSGIILVAEFGRPLDLGKLAKRLNALPDVKAVGANAIIIGGAGVPEVSYANGEYRVTLTNGWGDCMAGCIYREAWYFASSNLTAEWLGYTSNAGPTVSIRPSSRP